MSLDKYFAHVFSRLFQHLCAHVPYFKLMEILFHSRSLTCNSKAFENYDKLESFVSSSTFRYTCLFVARNYMKFQLMNEFVYVYSRTKNTCSNFPLRIQMSKSIGQLNSVGLYFQTYITDQVDGIGHIYKLSIYYLTIVIQIFCQRSVYVKSRSCHKRNGNGSPFRDLNQDHGQHRLYVAHP